MMLRSLLLIATCASSANAFVPAVPNAARTLASTPLQATALETSKVDDLIQANSATIKELSKIAPDFAEIDLLRFAMGFDSKKEAADSLREAIKYRSGNGKAVVEAAQKAYAEATAEGGWNNDVVRDSAPHASVINKFITEKNIISVSTKEGNLVYIIRASLIDDKKLMQAVSVKQMEEFFMYVKEVHNLVANDRSIKSGKLSQVIFANDIKGVRKPPDSDFSKALTESSNQYSKYYPYLAGPTMITNLPFVLQAFVGLIKPLFPKAVQDRLKFVRAPVLGGIKELTPIARDPATKKAFLDEIDKLLR
ncbi:unnamed protein product [Cylindrotheca closterium]|uniref:CRAL-TRIO domain-containing protein n=1 Tax=Cylindrotheca closterium TaxID=2856 RepID=A0AAD2FBK0_9STRA|nr:unnamed protein product [Cylindrotheca closterium]